MNVLFANKAENKINRSTFGHLNLNAIIVKVLRDVIMSYPKTQKYKIKCLCFLVAVSVWPTHIPGNRWESWYLFLN